MKRSSSLYLYLLAAVIVLGILAISIRSIYEDRQYAWREAEKSSRNLLTTLSRDIASRINLVDLSLKGIVEGLRTPEFQKLPPDIQHGRLFDRTATVSFTGTFFLLDTNGDLVADGGSIIAPRPWNSSERDYFQVHKTNRLTGLYLGHPHKSAAANDDLSIILSRRISGRNGEFAGVVAARISLSSLHDLLKSLDLGLNGSVSLFRADGILLMRHPYDADQIGRDLSDTPTVKRFIREDSGQFEGTAALDGVRRFYTFERVDHFPLVLSVALSVDEIVAPWRRKAMVLGLVTGVLCSAVVGLLVVFRRELQRRTRAEAELSRLARTDTLTGLPNRRAFDEIFEREWRQAIRSDSPLSLLYIDADHFKRYNDSCGHGMGDDLLRALASTLTSSIRRPRDLAARYGGEEFAVLLPDTDRNGALSVAETMRQAVLAMGIRHDQSPHNVATISIGVASVRPSSGMLRSALLEAADDALYRAKAEGRNCVRVTETADTRTLV